MHFRKAVALAAAMSYAVIAGTTAAASAQTLQGKALVSALQRGGYVIVLRHALTDTQHPDRPVIDLNDCRTQRVLTDDGRELARTIGDAFDRNYIPVGTVLASPLCRTMWTANLAFGHATAVAGLREPKPKNAANGIKAAAVLRPLIATAPAAGTNTVIVTHGFNVHSVAAFTPAEGEAAIFKPNGNGTFTLIARVKGADWSKLGK